MVVCCPYNARSSSPAFLSSELTGQLQYLDYSNGGTGITTINTWDVYNILFHMIVFAPVRENDLIAIREIYNYYILNTTATFHNELITIPELKDFLYINNPKYPSFVMKEDDRIIGYCFLTRHKNRQAYDRTAELSIYLQPEFTGKGIGSGALHYLEDAARKAGICVIIGTLCGENHASIRLMEKNGYTQCAHLKNIGEKFGKILDVVMYQKEI